MNESTMQATQAPQQPEHPVPAQEQPVPQQAEAPAAAAPAVAEPSAGGPGKSREPEGQSAPDQTAAAQEQAPSAEDPAARLSALTQRAAEAELRAAAALSGVPAEKLPYALRMCDPAALCAQGADMAALAREQVAAVLRDVPELAGRGGSLPGSLGDHKRVGAAPSAEDEARETFAKFL